MRVLLIRPPARHTVESEVPEAVEAENLSYPPLALLALASFLRDHSHHQCELMDAQLDNLSNEEMEEQIREYAPDVVGITCFTVQLVDVMHSIRAARSAEVPYVVLGGPHINDFPKESLALEGVDAVVKGEGQQPLLELLKVWESGGIAKGIKGVIAHEDDEIPEEDVYFSNDLDEYPIVDRTLVDYTRYYDVMGEGGIFTSIVTSRGCPYRCTFCNTPRHRYRVQSPERVCDEIEECLRLGIKEIYFVDDTFNITNRRVHELCDEIIRRGLEFSWTVRFRVKGVDRPLLLKMKEAGCSRIQLGVEQGTEEGLLRLKKDVTSREIEQAFRLCREVFSHSLHFSGEKLFKLLPEFKLKISLEEGMREILKEMDKDGRIINSAKQNWEDRIIRKKRKGSIKSGLLINAFLYNIDRVISAIRRKLSKLL